MTTTPCPCCGARVIIAQVPGGKPVALDVAVRILALKDSVPEPVAVTPEPEHYAEHVCPKPKERQGRLI